MDGTKILELRCRAVRGEYYLADSTTHTVKGKVTFGASRELSQEEYENTRDQHCDEQPMKRYKTTVGTTITSVQPLAQELSYKAKRGAIGFARFQATAAAPGTLLTAGYSPVRMDLVYKVDEGEAQGGAEAQDKAEEAEGAAKKEAEEDAGPGGGGKGERLAELSATKARGEAAEEETLFTDAELKAFERQANGMAGSDMKELVHLLGRECFRYQLDVSTLSPDKRLPLLKFFQDPGRGLRPRCVTPGCTASRAPKGGKCPTCRYLAKKAGAKRLQEEAKETPTKKQEAKKDA